MTRQQLDVLEYNGQAYRILETESFTEEAGFREEVSLYRPPFLTSPMSTACYRGFLCRFTTKILDNKDETVILADLQALIAAEANDEGDIRRIAYPLVNGVAASVFPESDACREGIYRGLNIPLTKFSGRLLLGTNEISPDVLDRWDDATRYSTVLELHVTNGRITKTVDLSEDVAARRSQHEANPHDIRLYLWSYDRFLEAVNRGEIDSGDDDDL